jgi:hypothetical protein
MPINFEANLVCDATNTTSVTTIQDAFVDTVQVLNSNHNASGSVIVSPSIFREYFLFKLPASISTISELCLALAGFTSSVGGNAAAQEIQCKFHNPLSNFTFGSTAQLSNVQLNTGAAGPTNFATNMREDVVASPFHVFLENALNQVNPINNQTELRAASRSLVNQFTDSFVSQMTLVPLNPFATANVNNPANSFKQLILGFGTFEEQEERAIAFFNRVIAVEGDDDSYVMIGGVKWFKFPFLDNDTLTCFMALQLNQPFGAGANPFTSSAARAALASNIELSYIANQIQTWNSAQATSDIPSRVYKIQFILNDIKINHIITDVIEQAILDAEAAAADALADGEDAASAAAAYQASALTFSATVGGLVSADTYISEYAYIGVSNVEHGLNEYDFREGGMGRNAMRTGINQFRLSSARAVDSVTPFADLKVNLWGAGKTESTAGMENDVFMVNNIADPGATVSTVISGIASSNTNTAANEVRSLLVNQEEFIAAYNANNSFAIDNILTKPYTNEATFFQILHTGVSTRKRWYYAPTQEEPYLMIPLIANKQFMRNALQNQDFVDTFDWINTNADLIQTKLETNGLLYTNLIDVGFTIKFLLHHANLLNTVHHRHYQFTRHDIPFIDPYTGVVTLNSEDETWVAGRIQAGGATMMWNIMNNMGYTAVTAPDTYELATRASHNLMTWYCNTLNETWKTVGSKNTSGVDSSGYNLTPGVFNILNEILTGLDHNGAASNIVAIPSGLMKDAMQSDYIAGPYNTRLYLDLN